MKILLFKVNHLGDNLVFLPVVQTLRERHPDWQLTVVTTPAEAVLYRDALEPERIWARQTKPAYDRCWRRPWELAAWWRRIRRLRPDACLVSYDQGNVSHLLAKYSGAGVRIGGNLSFIRLRHSLTHEVPKTATHQHVVDWNWAMARTLVRAAGGTDWPEVVPAPRLEHLAPAPNAPRTRVVIHAGARDALRQWPLERMAELAGRLARTHSVDWIERPETHAPHLPASVQRVPTTTLAELVTVLRRAGLYVGNNSGPMHFAAAIGTPCVVISGPTSYGWDPYWFPDRHTVLRMLGLACQPCERNEHGVTTCANLATPRICLQHWTVDAVEAACRRTLANPARD